MSILTVFRSLKECRVFTEIFCFYKLLYLTVFVQIAVGQSESGCVTGSQSSVCMSTLWTVTTLLLHLEMGEHVCPPLSLLLSLSSSLLSPFHLPLSLPPFFLLPTFPFSFLSPLPLFPFFPFFLFFISLNIYLVVSDLFLTVAYGIHTHSSAAVWDCRNVKGYNSCVQRVASSRTVTSAYFSPLSGQKLLTTSLDNHIW